MASTGPHDCTCGYPGRSAQDLDEHLIAMARVDDDEPHAPAR
jgi:hypothetical protein